MPNSEGSGWSISKDGKTRSEIAKEREASLKPVRSAQMKKRWEDPEYRQQRVLALTGRTMLKGRPLSDEHCAALRKKRALLPMTIEQRAWVGAFIEADGAVTAGPSRRGRDRIVITVSQVNPEPISVLLRVTGAGTVSYGSEIFTWSVAAWNDAMPLLEAIAPYCEKAQVALTKLPDTATYEEVRSLDKKLRG